MKTVPVAGLAPVGGGGFGLPGAVARIAVRAFPAPVEGLLGPGVPRTEGLPALDPLPFGLGLSPLTEFLPFPLGLFGT